MMSKKVVSVWVSIHHYSVLLSVNIVSNFLEIELVHLLEKIWRDGGGEKPIRGFGC